MEEAEKVAAELGYPVVLRPAYTMGGTGGGIVYNVEELRQIVPPMLLKYHLPLQNFELVDVMQQPSYLFL